MVEASSDNVEAHFNGHEKAGRRCLVLLKDKLYLAALDLAQGLYHGRFAGELLGRYAPGARRGLAAVALARAMPASPLVSPMNDFASISRVRFA
jgi:hypothetical protein